MGHASDAAAKVALEMQCVDVGALDRARKLRASIQAVGKCLVHMQIVIATRHGLGY